MARWQQTRPAPTAARQDRKKLTWTVEFLTPMFGGGVLVNPEPEDPDPAQRKLKDRRHVKEPDPITPVRVSSIRGQLRFWWRAAIGSRLSSVSSMRDRETALFGAATRRSTVAIQVRGQPQPRRLPVFEMRQGRRGPQGQPGLWNPRALPTKGFDNLAYACFPLQPPGSLPQPLDPGTLHEMSGAFELEVTCRPTDQADVERTVETWLALGGLGGRTRRGFGSLAGGTWPLERVLGGFEIGDAITRGFSVENLPDGARRYTHIGGPGLPGVPSLAGGMCATRVASSSDSAHRNALGKLRDMRQGRGFGRNSGGDRPGRSRWPEPDEIRRLTNQQATGHSPVHPVRAFPRGLFGMPVIFHFKRERPTRDPSDTTLKPRGTDMAGNQIERMASPLMLRPWREPGTQRSHALLFVLGDPDRATISGTLSGQLAPGSSPNVDIQLSAAEASWPNSPLAGQPDPLLAFLDYFLE